MKENVVLNRFNYGMISKLALARQDISKLQLGAAIQTNIIGRALGAGRFRPGLGYITPTYNNSACYNIPFVFAINDTAVVEITDSLMRVLVDDVVVTRPTVTTAIANGAFTSDLSSWTQDDDAGTTSYWSGGFMVLRGTRYNLARRRQEVTVAGVNLNVEHAVRVTITRGPVIVKIGSTSGAQDYFAETELEAGVYSVAFTPTGNFWIEFANRAEEADALVDSVSIEAAGELTLALPYTTSNFQYLRHTQSGDVIYVVCDGCPIKKILRFSTNGWGVADYLPKDGPFRSPNTSGVRLTASALTGQINLVSSKPYFDPDMVGGLFQLTSVGQNVTANLSGADQYTDPIKVTGISGNRAFTVTRSGTWSGTLYLQRSVGEVGAWVDAGSTYTTNATTSENDGQDNQIIYYRVGFKSATYTSGTAAVSLSYAGGGITGTCRVLEYTNTTNVIASALNPLGGTTATELWSEGAWSAYRGYPSANTLFEGRMWMAGKDNIWGSLSDSYESFDDQVEGDSGLISRNLGEGPIDRINWLLALDRLAIGTETSERNARSSSLDEPLTPDNFNIKTPSTRGSSPVQAEVVDINGFFTRNDRLFKLSYEAERAAVDYASSDMTIICPEVGDSGFKQIEIQRYPDTRIHCLRNDGKVALFVFDAAEDVQCWQIVETDGVIEDMYVLPAEANATEDRVYYVVRRVINGVTKRYHERWALESECVGGSVNKLADSFVTATVSGAAITGLSHLEGESVVVWADGRDYSEGYGASQTLYTVASGAITLPDSLATGETAVIGLPYSGKYKSMKLAYGAQMGTALTQAKRCNYVGLIMCDTHAKGLRYGRNFDNLDEMPEIHQGAPLDGDTVHEDYDELSLNLNGNWSTDSRLCLQMDAPRPCTVLACVVSVNTNERA